MVAAINSSSLAVLLLDKRKLQVVIKDRKGIVSVCALFLGPFSSAFLKSNNRHQRETRLESLQLLHIGSCKTDIYING